MSFTAVGATNVGSIVIEMDEDLKTNTKSLKHVHCSEINLDASCQKGAYFGEFNFGSTIVLVMEAPEDGFEINVKNGQKIKVGQPLIKST